MTDQAHAKAFCCNILLLTVLFIIFRAHGSKIEYTYAVNVLPLSLVILCFRPVLYGPFPILFFFHLYFHPSGSGGNSLHFNSVVTLPRVFTLDFKNNLTYRKVFDHLKVVFYKC